MGMSSYREVEETLNIHEDRELPVEVDGQLTISQTDITRDADDATAAVHGVATEVSEAIAEALEEFREVSE
jgi:antitoxin component of MazEF toxin-antitoxin module